MAAIEAPGMIARIPLIGKLSSAALPFQSYFVFGHVSYMECGQALGNHLFFRGRPGKLTDVVGKFTWRCAAANPPYALLNGSWRKFVGHNYARTLLAWCCGNDFDLLLALGQSISFGLRMTQGDGVFFVWITHQFNTTTSMG